MKKNATVEETRITPITDHEKKIVKEKKNACVAVKTQKGR
jgi:hypothetical protein